MKKIARKIASITLAVSMACSLLSIGGLAEKKEAKAATTGTWVLTGEKANVGAGYGNKSVEERTGDGSTELTSGMTTDPDYHIRNVEYMYKGKFSGNVRFVSYMSYKPNNEPEQFSYVYSECSEPEEEYSPGETVTLTLSSWLGDNSGGYGNGEGVSASLDGSYFVDSSGEKTFYTEVVDLASNGKTNHVVTNKMPSNPSIGSTCVIHANLIYGTWSGEYEWTYTFKAGSALDDDDDADSIGEDDDDEDDIVVGQVKNVKLTNKKVKRIYISYSAVSGAKGYEIQYATNKKLSGAKKLTTTATKGYFKNAKGKKATFKKGKTYYVRVRAYAKDSSGDKVYGKWSAKKKVKIKK